jgi:hypothetical protein
VPSVTLWTELHAIALRAARRFGTPRRVVIKPLLTHGRPKKDGDALRQAQATPQVRIRVHRYHRPRQALKRSTIMATFAHELAHLATWEEKPAHGPRWWALAREIAAWLRDVERQPVSSQLRHGTYPRCHRKRRA